MINKTELQKVFDKLPVEKVELSIAQDLKILVNALNSQLSIDDRVRKEGMKLFSTLVTAIPKAKERIKTNKSVIKATDGKTDLGVKALQRAEISAKELGVNPAKIANYSKVSSLVKEVTKSQRDIEDLTNRLERLIR